MAGFRSLINKSNARQFRCIIVYDIGRDENAGEEIKLEKHPTIYNKSNVAKIINHNVDYKPEKGILMKRMMVMVCIGMFLGIFLIPSGTAAWNDVQLQQLKTKNHCPNCDLSGANLRGANLRRANLSGANLTKVNLSGVDLSGVDLSGADLSGADLQGAYLGGACLTGACLSQANLNMANLNMANLGYAKWTDGSTCKKGSIRKCNK